MKYKYGKISSQSRKLFDKMKLNRFADVGLMSTGLRVGKLRLKVDTVIQAHRHDGNVSIYPLAILFNQRLGKYLEDPTGRLPKRVK